MLTPRQLAIYLVDRGLLPPESIVFGELTIETATGRNYNHKIRSVSGPGLFTKQSCDTTATLGTEARLYKIFQRSRERHPLAQYLPKLRLFDRQRQLLALDLLPRAEPIAKHFRLRKRHFRSDLAGEVGRALALLHTAHSRNSPLAPTGVPWVLSLPTPRMELLIEISAANLEMVRIIQESSHLCKGFSDLAASWREDSIIHNDLRWDNCLVTHRAATGSTLKMIDWELSGFGDADWDIGSVFANFLALWLFSMRFVPGTTPARMIRTAVYKVEAMQSAIRSFWTAYTDGHATNNADHASLMRAVRFMAARLVQLAYERHQYSRNITGNVVLLLQVSENILRRPEVAALELLGLRKRDRVRHA